MIPGAPGAIRRLRDAGFVIVVVTNQSGVGRGLYTLEQLGRVHDEMAAQLSAEGARVDAVYAATDVPSAPGKEVVEFLDRKPGPGMLYRAAEALGLDLGSSWMVGDTPGDLGAGLNAGCLGVVLVRSGRAPEALDAVAPPVPVVDDLAAAADLILQRTGAGPAPKGTNA